MSHTIRIFLRSGAALALLLLLGAQGAGAQGTITGTVTDAETGEPLAGASVVIDGTTRGTAADADGSYTLGGVEAGQTALAVSFIGYAPTTRVVSVRDGQDTEADFALQPANQMLEDIEVFASRARDRYTPVAFTDVEKVQIERQLGGRDIPLVLNTAPSVYSTASGGGKGDARITVRGFSQRNTAVMINGVPVNDMENGWVYWSNWDAVGDVASSLQLQRGLSAVNLAVPSIGGTLNIVTDPAERERGASFKQELGSGTFRKSTLSFSTGQVDDRFALTVQGTRTTGDGVVDGTWIDSWSYYTAASYDLNANNRLSLYAVGAPQRHGQFLYQQNIAAFSQEFARDVFSDEVLRFDEDGNGVADVFETYPESQAGLEYNQNWAPVDPDYDGKQAVEGDRFYRQVSNFINERENFYHKPQVNLNWYSQLSEGLNLSTVVYYSGGYGGGTGTLGSIEWNYSTPTRTPDWNASIAQNRTAEIDAETGAIVRPAGQAAGIIRNSRNNQWTVGGISKLRYRATEALSVEVGLDARVAEVEHYREVRDLLGADYWVVTEDQFNPNRRARLGDKVDYNFTNDIYWGGGYLQSEYATEAYSLYGMAALTGIQYTHTNHFVSDGGEELQVETDWIPGYQFKLGGLVNLTERLDAFLNAGYISKVPIFDGVIDDGNGALNADPTNEKFYAVEGGTNFRLPVQGLVAKLNLYSTWRQDRTVTQTVRNEQGGVDGLVNLAGVNQWHRGAELELTYQPTDLVRFDGAAAVNNWEFTDDATGTYRSDRGQAGEEYNYYIEGLKVGNAPQTQFSYALTLFPIDGMDFQVVGLTFADHFADFDPVTRTDANDRAQSWQAPGYTKFDLHAGYNLPAQSLPVDVRFEAHVFNLLDEVYIQDATDNSRFNAFSANGVNHSADDAEVFLGLPRTFTIGVKVGF